MYLIDSLTFCFNFITVLNLLLPFVAQLPNLSSNRKCQFLPLTELLNIKLVDTKILYSLFIGG